jgi:hypothetical protein
MQLIKNIYAHLDQLKKLFLQIKRLSSWTNFKPVQDREAIDAIIQKRQVLLNKIGEVVQTLVPLKDDLDLLNISDVVKEIIVIKYQELEALQALIENADHRLMTRIQKSLAALKQEITLTSTQQRAAISYLQQQYSIAS